MAKKSLPGWLYVLSSPAMIPGLLKIGHTVRDPKTRAVELADATGVPCAFVLEHAERVENSERLEGIVHRLLADRRLSPNREFFLCTVDEAKAAIAAAVAGEKPPKTPPALSVTLPKGWRAPVVPAKRLPSDRKGQISDRDQPAGRPLDPDDADLSAFEEAEDEWSRPAPIVATRPPRRSWWQRIVGLS